MQRWKLWTSVASGLLSVGSGSSYYFWNQTSAREPAQVAAASPAESSPHSAPPQPILDTATNSDPSATRYATPASFNEPSPEETNAQGNGGSDAFPSRSSFDANPRYTIPAKIDLTQRQNEGAPANRAAFSDQGQSPAASITGVEAEPAPRDTIAPPAPVAEQSEAAPPAVTTQVPDRVPYGLPVVTEEVNQPSPATAPAAADPVALPVPQPDPRRGSLNRFNTPAAPALRSSLSAESRLRTSEPPATLPENEAPLPATLAPRPTLGAKSTHSVPRATQLISNSPGERKLEGLQAPSLTVERSAPEEIQVGRPTKFVIRVRNVGQVTAQDVVVTDQIPQGTRFLAAAPEASPTADGALAWELGALQPGEESTVTIELMPEAEGEIGSVAEVTFRTQAAVRTIATKPLLKIDHSGPARVLIGEEVPLQITVSNPGSGVATGVVIEVDVPEGLAHDGGREIMSDRFELRPNESRKIDLVLRAVQPGVVQSMVRAVGDSNLKAEHRAQLDVVAPRLQIGVAGPTRRFLDRPVKYQITIDNPGTAPAQELELVARLPRGLKYISADKKGQYDQRQHAVLWSLEELPADGQGVVELTALPTDTGEQKLHVEARAALGLEHQHEHTTVVEDITDLVFTVTDENVPIEVGSETTYQIRVANNGTKVARNVRLAVQVPDGLEVIDSGGPTPIQQQGGQLAMQPIAELGQREEAVYRITAKGTRAGDHVLRVQLLSDEFSSPVTKEEITKVYADK